MKICAQKRYAYVLLVVFLCGQVTPASASWVSAPFRWMWTHPKTTLCLGALGFFSLVIMTAPKLQDLAKENRWDDLQDRLQDQVQYHIHNIELQKNLIDSEKKLSDELKSDELKKKLFSEKSANKRSLESVRDFFKADRVPGSLKQSRDLVEYLIRDLSEVNRKLESQPQDVSLRNKQQSLYTALHNWLCFLRIYESKKEFKIVCFLCLIWLHKSRDVAAYLLYYYHPQSLSRNEYFAKSCFKTDSELASLWDIVTNKKWQNGDWGNELVLLKHKVGIILNNSQNVQDAAQHLLKKGVGSTLQEKETVVKELELFLRGETKPRVGKTYAISEEVRTQKIKELEFAKLLPTLIDYHAERGSIQALMLKVKWDI